MDLRERVVGAVAAGQTCRSVAKTFMVSVASVVKWSQRQRAVGSPAALKMGGHRPYLVACERDWVLARIAEKPDLTLRALHAQVNSTTPSFIRRSTQKSPKAALLASKRLARPDSPACTVSVTPSHADDHVAVTDLCRVI